MENELEMVLKEAVVSNNKIFCTSKSERMSAKFGLLYSG